MEPLYLQYNGPTGAVDLYFDTLLHQRASDFTLIRKSWDDDASSKLAQDSTVLQIVVTRLFQPDTGIPKLHIKDYRVEAEFGLAVSAEYIVEILVEALTEAGYEVIIGQKPPSQKWLTQAAEGGLAQDATEQSAKPAQSRWYWLFGPPR